MSWNIIVAHVFVVVVFSDDEQLVIDMTHASPRKPSSTATPPTKRVRLHASPRKPSSTATPPNKRVRLASSSDDEPVTMDTAEQQGGEDGSAEEETAGKKSRVHSEQ